MRWVVLDVASRYLDDRELNIRLLRTENSLWIEKVVSFFLIYITERPQIRRKKKLSSLCSSKYNPLSLVSNRRRTLYCLPTHGPTSADRRVLTDIFLVHSLPLLVPTSTPVLHRTSTNRVVCLAHSVFVLTTTLPFTVVLLTGSHQEIFWEGKRRVLNHSIITVSFRHATKEILRKSVEY